VVVQAQPKDYDDGDHDFVSLPEQVSVKMNLGGNLFMNVMTENPDSIKHIEHILREKMLDDMEPLGTNYETTERGMFHHSSNDPEERQRRIISEARIASLAYSNLTVEQLYANAIEMIQLHHYRAAVNTLTLAIDKIHVENPFCSISKETRIFLVKIYIRRVECNVRIGQRRENLECIEQALEDCLFILHTGIFDHLLNTEKGKELTDELRKLENEAYSIRDILLSQQHNMINNRRVVRSTASSTLDRGNASNPGNSSGSRRRRARGRRRPR
jgi:hypothetical protein